MSRIFRAICLAFATVLPVVASAAEPPSRAVTVALARGVNLPIWFTYRGQSGIDPARWYPDAADWQRIAALGFTHVRVQFDPAWFREGSAGGALDRVRLAELQRGLAAAFKRGLVVVLAAEPEPEEKLRLLRDAAGQAELVQFWSAFAAALRSASPKRLVFEALNEPVSLDAAGNRVLMQNLAAAIRRAAPGHTIVVEGHGYAGIDELMAFEPLSMDNLVYSFHFYEPHSFTHQGAFWGWPMFMKFKGLPYPSTPEALAPLAAAADDEARPHVLAYGDERWDAARIGSRLWQVRNWAEQKQVAIWCGEFGVTRLGPPIEDRRRWLADTRNGLAVQGIPYALFDYAGHFGLLTGNAGARVLDPLDAQALGLKAPRPAAQ